MDNIICEQGADVRKVDIEGAEILALKGATNTLKRLHKVIVEIHGDNFFSVKRLWKKAISNSNDPEFSDHVTHYRIKVKK